MINEDHSGLDAAALRRIQTAIESDIEAGRYDGANIIVSRRGEIGLQASIGWSDRKAGRTAAPEDIYRIFSMTKAFTNVLALQAIDRGELALTTRVVDVIPEFYGRDRFRTARKDRVNLAHLLTHRAGLVTTPTPLPYDELGDLGEVVDAICQLDVVGEPGTTLNYSPALNHALIAEMVRRATGAECVRDLMKREIFEPLGMDSTALGAPRKWAEHYVPVRASFPDGGWLSTADIEVMEEIITEEAEMPWVGAVSTVEDIHSFAEMLRRRGEYDGKRVLSPAILDLATTNQTGDLPNDLYRGLAEARGWDVPPGNFGLGFALSGTGTHASFFGSATSPRTHGNYGAGSTLFWVDPERDLTFACLTAGVMEESENVLRFQRLSTLAAAAAL
ncbi:serine hydrolase domain-containing protein [Streptomyces violens]|uniref:serine hydrolase domain-containing protein n=1 Tax=Streptomyces violens TaxID=66377 RepID=UPI000AF56520|nr:serine hydrolase domain-containing protein [Streptomyces violens]